VRTVAEASGYAYGKSDGALWTNFYGGNAINTSLNGRRLSISQETDYPWSGQITLAVNHWEGGEFDLKLRIPAWARSANVLVNGQPAKGEAVPGSYATVRRSWKVGDRIQLEIPMPVELIESHPLVEETRNHIAIKRGPLVYCLETPGLPKGVTLKAVALRSDAKYTPRFDDKTLGGVVVIETDAENNPSKDWQGQLYRPLDSQRERTERIMLTPYFAWANRGPAEMSVWLPWRR
jgi:DUF1680 family protein